MFRNWIANHGGSPVERVFVHVNAFMSGADAELRAKTRDLSNADCYASPQFRKVFSGNCNFIFSCLKAVRSKRAVRLTLQRARHAVIKTLDLDFGVPEDAALGICHLTTERASRNLSGGYGAKDYCPKNGS